MTELSKFIFGSLTVRVMLQGGEPWFFAGDVCSAMDLNNPSQALTRLDDAERALISNEGGGTLAIVSESGLYALVFGSRKASAKAFKRWVTGTVLPEIRRTGSYQGSAVPGIPQTFAEALRLAADNLDRAEAAERQVAKMEPKVAALDRFANHAGSYKVREAGAMLGIGQNSLVSWLLEHRWMYRQFPGAPLSVMADKDKAGYVTAKATKAGVLSDGTERAGIQARITTKGLDEIATRLAEAHQLPAPVLTPSARMAGRSLQ